MQYRFIYFVLCILTFMLLFFMRFDILYPKRHDNSLNVLDKECLKILNTRKMNFSCYPDAIIYPLLITGAGGAGSHEITRRMRSIGIDIDHEAFGSVGAVGWMYAVNDKFVRLAYPHQHESFHALSRFTTVLHVIRCPLHQISSLTSHTSKSFHFIAHSLLTMNISIDDKDYLRYYLTQTLPCHRGDPCNLKIAALTWLLWNEHITSYADELIKIEEVDRYFENFCPKHKDLCTTTVQYSNQHTNSIGGKPKFSSTHIRSSVHHAKHVEYTLHDVSKVDAELSRRIEHTARSVFGYGDECLYGVSA